MTTTQLNPDKWATSFYRALFNYVKTKWAITGNPASDVYELIESYPDVDFLTRKMPLPLTLVHFEIDDIENVPLGIGEGVVNSFYDASGHSVQDWEAHCHIVPIDVGVWASVESGGPPARLEAREDLDRIFNGPAARTDCMTITNGVEILSFTGGRFLTDSINDIPVFRIVDQELRVRVYSRLKKTPATAIEDVGQNPEMMISGEVIIG